MKTLMTALIACCSITVMAQNKPLTTTYNIDTQKSKIEWAGKKVAGPHNGYITAKGGTLTLQGDEITSGHVLIDMSSITATDLEGEWKYKLETHLKNADFFDTTKYPESTLVIKNSKKAQKGLDISADLTIKGITRPITFTATDIKKTIDGFSAKAKLVIDRTKFGVVYNTGSGDKNLMKQLGDKLIYDDFTLNIKLVANK